MGTLDLIRRRLPDERSQALVEGALHAAERARSLVGRLLSFARRQTLKPQAVDLLTLVNGMRELIERSLGPRIKVVIAIEEGLPALLVDPHQLRELGYRVVEADSASSALQLIIQGVQVDALVTDQLMPGKAGVELARELREHLPGLPVLIITGYANLSPEQLQGFEVLAKPFRGRELAAALGRLLDEAPGLVAK
ncbi:hypothetical protein PSEMO_35480 [Pseudomonas putida]|uniref:Response regulatory domain-containing protein n=1 Tax=Pseudomonas putida TaxID=303 RepID=A0A1Q9R274_PSEPU|nr:hypothetical protein PSEMO_35480 [Pseudomonas putida]